MSVSSTSSTSVSDLASVLLRRFDANADGKLSGEEFGSLLGQLLGRISDGSASSTTTNAAATTTTTTRARVGTMAGFDEAKLSNPDHGTFKYQIGRILQYYPNNAEGLRQALPEIQRIVPGATITGSNGDKLDFGNYLDPKSGRIGVVDVIVAAGGPAGGTAWAWQPVE